MIELTTTTNYLTLSEIGDAVAIELLETSNKLELIVSNAGLKGDEGKHIESVSFVNNDMVFVNDDLTEVTLVNAKIDLKGEQGTTDYNDLTNKPTIPNELSDLSSDATHRTVTDSEKSTWNGKSDLVIGELSTNAGAGDKTKTAYDHSQTAHAPSDANNYVHPTNHPASIITQDTSNRFVSDAEKSTWNGKSDLALGDLSSNAYSGDKGKTAYDHSQTAHAPSNAQKNSDITKEEIEAKLIGEISTHTHAGSGGLSQQQIEGLMI